MDTILKSTFELKSVVPWGRTLNEYCAFFQLTEDDLKKNILSIGDGPASFNSEMHQNGNRVLSVDPIYGFSKAQLQHRIEETRKEVMTQVRQNAEKFIWHTIKNPDELERIRIKAMQEFIKDFDTGKAENRYLYHEMPIPIEYADNSFELGLSSHFLILYSKLGLDFHIQSITEMLRLCNEVRIFPLLNLNAEKSEVLDAIIDHFNKIYTVEIKEVDYEFQKNGNQFLSIKK
ncbi:SAM-dependent methyltransferase [uncultured Cytophaga sp.]|uniref:SAM-dependent methyltransferase n=1 Tax=uncultured Cytophaga sp. TaxID=160238 RepID=UPI00260DFC58|nr:SAM-dependent methyltransferase [uncultured Cytophaga sp.]